ncbi:SMP-30/gluconolactonase/LRE family protein [Winogradskyella endarachnes]|uniref:SMP-30/gluconolactonase/LRE family protein n=1 Tax=Winogradskyella endarachnes TaxID=2681965 RepID=A0A6L6UAY0_9FLAO|nr:SMP-30/gluconolactonase/LRE family protein [Winogradskyella endarachnes]MUU79129.1 SMP-30/gluconolactonase/LRE family protein [Winogradskyella endarachnes]
MLKYVLCAIVSITLISCGITNDTLSTTEENKVTLAYLTKAKLGEGAIWNDKTKELYWIDIEGKSLNIYNPKTNINKVLKTPSRVGTVVPKNKTEALVALEDGIHTINLKTGSTSLFLNMKDDLKGKRLNDGKCDPSGRFWVGSMHFNQTKGEAKLFCVTNKPELETKIDSVTISNGIVWTSDKQTMYYIDTPTSQIKAYDFNNDTGAISNERIAVEIPEELGYPDGMTIDKEDMLWVGMWNGNAVIRFNPNTGKVLKRIEVPAHNITSCAFGGDNLEILFITSARVDMTVEELENYPLAGSIFKVVPGVKGVKSNFFKN